MLISLPKLQLPAAHYLYFYLLCSYWLFHFVHVYTWSQNQPFCRLLSPDTLGIWWVHIAGEEFNSSKPLPPSPSILCISSDGQGNLPSPPKRAVQTDIPCILFFHSSRHEEIYFQQIPWRKLRNIFSLSLRISPLPCQSNLLAHPCQADAWALPCQSDALYSSRSGLILKAAHHLGLASSPHSDAHSEFLQFPRQIHPTPLKCHITPSSPVLFPQTQSTTSKGFYVPW